MSDDSVFLALYVDWQTVTGSVERWGYCINFGVANPPALEAKLRAGSRVIIHDMELRCEAILERSSCGGQWFGIPIPETSRDLEPGEFERLEAAMKRAASEI